MVENIIKQTPFRRETSLAKTKDLITEARPKLSNDMAMGYITSIDHQKNTCSVMLDNNHNNTIGSTNVVPNVPLPVNGYGVNKDGNYYGDYPNVAQGVRVLLGYIGGDTSQPVVLGIYPPQEFISHLTPTKEGLVDDTPLLASDLWSYKKVFPSQQVQLDEGNGNSTRTFNGHSFISAMLTDSTANQNQYDVNYTGIENKNNNITQDFYLKAFQDFTDNEEYKVNDLAQDFVLINQSTSTVDNHLTKLMVKSTGELQEIFNNKVIDNKLLRVDAGLFDGYRITNQLDTKDDNPNHYLKLEINDDHIQFYAQEDKNTSKLEITPNGSYLDGEQLLSKHGISQLDEDIKSLKGEVNPLIATLANNDGIEGIIQKISNNTGNYNTLKTRVDGLKVFTDKTDDNDKWIKTFTAGGNDSETLESINDELKKLGNNNVDHDKWIKMFTAGKNNYETLATINSSIKTNSDDISSLKGSVDTSAKDITKINSGLESINSSIKTNSDDIGSLKGSVDTSAKDITKINSGLESINSSIKTNSDNLDTTNKELTDLIKKLKDKKVID